MQVRLETHPWQKDWRICWMAMVLLMSLPPCPIGTALTTVSADAFEDRGVLRINRVAIPSHKSGFLDQILSFRRYYMETQKLITGNEYDLVFASSSRLFTAFRRISNGQKNEPPPIP